MVSKHLIRFDLVSDGLVANTMSSACSQQHSSLMLGTVQLGRPYGVANRLGQPSYEAAVEILTTALEGGITSFDTAANYGTSETVLGRVFRELGVQQEVFVVTKPEPLTEDQAANSRRARAALEASVARSRERLQLESLPLVLFHRESDVVHGEHLERLQEAGWIQGWGISCDNEPGPAAGFLTDPRIAAIQVPGSLLDRRHLRSGILAEGAERKLPIFVRSVFLQGLLAMPSDQIPDYLKSVVPIRNQFAQLASQAGMELPELALRYVISLRGVVSALIGVESVPQLKANLAMAGRGPLDETLLIEIEQIQVDLSEPLITPKRWPALKSSGQHETR